jgi:hypothetical protein
VHGSAVGGGHRAAGVASCRDLGTFVGEPTPLHRHAAARLDHTVGVDVLIRVTRSVAEDVCQSWGDPQAQQVPRTTVGVRERQECVLVASHRVAPSTRHDGGGEIGCRAQQFTRGVHLTPLPRVGHGRQDALSTLTETHTGPTRPSWGGAGRCALKLITDVAHATGNVPLTDSWP